jgi:hypothetical protein
LFIINKNTRVERDKYHTYKSNYLRLPTISLVSVLGPSVQTTFVMEPTGFASANLCKNLVDAVPLIGNLACEVACIILLNNSVMVQ